MLHRRIADALNRDAIVANLRTFTAQAPEFARLAQAVAINEEVAHAEIFYDVLRMIDRFAHDDHGAIGVIRQPQDGRRTGAAQSLMIAAQRDGLADLKSASGQNHFATGGGAIRFYLEDKRIRFEINKDAAQEQHHLKVSAQLLGLGKVVATAGAAGAGDKP